MRVSLPAALTAKCGVAIVLNEEELTLVYVQ